MPINNTDLTFYHSNGGGPGTLRINNKGGVISATEIVNGIGGNWFYDVTRAMMSGTWAVHCCLYVKNKNVTDIAYNVKCWIKTPYNLAGITTSIGVFQTGTPLAPGINVTATAIVNPTDIPSGVTFSSAATTEATALTIGQLNPGYYCGVWVRLNGSSGVGIRANGMLEIDLVYTDTLT